MEELFWCVSVLLNYCMSTPTDILWSLVDHYLFSCSSFFVLYYCTLFVLSLFFLYSLMDYYCTYVLLDLVILSLFSHGLQLCYAVSICFWVTLISCWPLFVDLCLFVLLLIVLLYYGVKEEPCSVVDLSLSSCCFSFVLVLVLFLLLFLSLLLLLLLLVSVLCLSIGRLIYDKRFTYTI